MQPQNRKHFKVKGVHMKKKKITTKSIHHNEAGDAFFYHNGQYESVENQNGYSYGTNRERRTFPSKHSRCANTEQSLMQYPNELSQLADRKASNSWQG